MDKFDRAQQLHRIFSSRKRPITKAELAVKLECSSKTIKRLVDNFRDLWRAPLEYSDKQKGWYYNLKDGEKFELPGLWLTADELQSLIALLHILHTMGEGLVSRELSIVEKTIGKLLFARGINPEDFTRSIKYIPLAKRHTIHTLFNTVADALIHRKQLNMAYKDYRGNVTQRTISPQTLIYYRENWHLDAYCHLREGLRTFAISRIEGVEKTRQKSITIEQDKLTKHFSSSYGIFAGKASHTAILLFSSEVAREVASQEWHPEQIGQWDGDSYRLTIPYKHDAELVMDILRYGSRAEVLAPASLRNKIKRALQSALGLY